MVFVPHGMHAISSMMRRPCSPHRLAQSPARCSSTNAYVYVLRVAAALTCVCWLLPKHECISGANNHTCSTALQEVELWCIMQFRHYMCRGERQAPLAHPRVWYPAHVRLLPGCMAAPAATHRPPGPHFTCTQYQARFHKHCIFPPECVAVAGLHATGCAGGSRGRSSTCCVSPRAAKLQEAHAGEAELLSQWFLTNDTSLMC